MKKHVAEFIRRGLTACGFGPMVLAVLYLALQQKGDLEIVSVNQVCLGIFSLSALAFVAGGLNILYQIERLPLMLAVLIHGSVLYGIYLGTYLLNGWLVWGITPILVFSGIFIVCYFAIWAFILFITKRRTGRLNQLLKERQKQEDA